MLRPHDPIVALAALVVACGGAIAVPTPTPTPTPTSTPTSTATSSAAATATRTQLTLAADTPTTTARGATFTAPKGWVLAKKGSGLQLYAPERDLTLTLVEVAEMDAEKAVAQAWPTADPTFARKPKQTAKLPARDGWDEVTQITYEATAAEARVVIAVARRKGGVHYVALIDGAAAGLDRRGAELMTAIGSFKAPGVEEESFAGKKANVLDAARLATLTTFLEESRVKAKVPGVGFAVVQGGKVVLEKGLGARALGKPEPVTADTVFIIGSITKSLTSLMMAKLVDEGRFGWDTPVTEVMPAFALGDADATKKLAMRHTVCACTGLPRSDMTFFFGYGRTTPESRVAEMKRLKPTTAFGETFQYSNLMVSAGGYLAAHAAEPKLGLGPAYDATMRSRVLDPIGMRSSTFDYAAADRRDHASPHAFTVTRDFTALPVASESWIPSIRPAGGLWSSAHDMARWVAVELAKGKAPDGKVVVSEKNLLERRKPMAKTDDKSAYGLGLMIERYHGVDVVWHTGGTLGFNTIALWLPEHDVGLVVLTNTVGAGAYLHAARRRFLEIVFDARDEAKENLVSGLLRRAERVAKELEKLDRAPGRSFVAAVAGDYSEPVLGAIKIRWDGTRGVVETPDWKSAFGRAKEDDGNDRLVLLDPPWVGFELLARKRDDGTIAIVLEEGQEKYTFLPAAQR
jgi:CubicO group peptidase (beta-lactamase class C family)